MPTAISTSQRDASSSARSRAARRQRLAEPDDVGADEIAAVRAARRSLVAARDVGQGEAGVALAHALEAQGAAVQLDHVARAGALVQAVDVLGHDGEGHEPLELGQGVVAGVGRGLLDLAEAVHVPAPHEGRVARVGLGGGELHGVVLGPEALARVAEGRDARLLRHAGAGVDHDARACARRAAAALRSAVSRSSSLSCRPPLTLSRGHLRPQGRDDRRPELSRSGELRPMPGRQIDQRRSWTSGELARQGWSLAHKLAQHRDETRFEGDHTLSGRPSSSGPTASPARPEAARPRDRPRRRHLGSRGRTCVLMVRSCRPPIITCVVTLDGRHCRARAGRARGTASS